MLAAQRQEEILTLIDEKGAMRTVDLAKKFKVTDETIRRDLLTLSQQDKVKRIHGGACSHSGRPKLRTFDERSGLNVEGKRAIARVARELIQPGKMYAFDSSTSVLALIELLPDLPFRVVTNALVVFERMVSMSNVELISVGGRYHPSTRTFVSVKSIQMLSQYHIDTAFISCIGFNIDHGASEGFEEQALYKETLAELADEVVLLIDSTKFKVQSEYYFAASEAMSHIITDSSIDPKIADEIRARGIRLTVADL